VRPIAAALIFVTLTIGTATARAESVALTSVAASPAEGTWRALNGSEISIAKCGEGLCGTLSFIVIPKQFEAPCEQDKAAFGEQMLDLRNQDTSLRTRKLLGLQILTLTATSDPRAFDAKIYNAEDGGTYGINVWILNDDQTLRVGGGCMGTVCAMTQDWPRVAQREVAPDFTCKPE
jgi:uncharacterized protein (DUF2147 family)